MAPAAMGDIMMKSSMVKRSIKIVGHKTSVSLEDPFWQLLNEIAQRQGERVSEIVAKIDKDREHANLSSAVRLFVLDYVRNEIAGHHKVARTRKKDGRGGSEEHP
jgi:predicted DNA-binding ribbon-helix-helix protein